MIGPLFLENIPLFLKNKRYYKNINYLSKSLPSIWFHWVPFQLQMYPSFHVSWTDRTQTFYRKNLLDQRSCRRTFQDRTAWIRRQGFGKICRQCSLPGQGMLHGECNHYHWRNRRIWWNHRSRNGLKEVK